jgi:hypothetical protein
LKKTKANISLFELLKLPQIQENLLRLSRDHLQVKEKILMWEESKENGKVVQNADSRKKLLRSNMLLMLL